MRVVENLVLEGLLIIAGRSMRLVPIVLLLANLLVGASFLMGRDELRALVTRRRGVDPS
ncbi:MAG: hypothetical protein U1E63_10465 [Burkholderiales bacterium]